MLYSYTHNSVNPQTLQDYTPWSPTGTQPLDFTGPQGTSLNARPSFRTPLPHPGGMEEQWILNIWETSTPRH